MKWAEIAASAHLCPRGCGSVLGLAACSEKKHLREPAVLTSPTGYHHQPLADTAPLPKS